ncbi:hypothetical protein EW146_g10270, partial [Bondarzewia mesenterica]
PVGGDSVVEGWNEKEWVPVLLRGSQVLKAVPKRDEAISWIPVDVTASALLEMLGSSEPSFTLSIQIPPNGASSATLLLSYLVSRLSRDHSAPKTNPALNLVDFFAKELANETSVVLSTERAARVSESLKGAKRLGREDVENWIAYWRGIGFLSKLVTMNRLASDRKVNAFACNFYDPNGRLDTEVNEDEANYLNRRIFERLSFTSRDRDPRKINFYITSTAFAQSDYKDCAMHFKNRPGLRKSQDLFVLRNVVMSSFSTSVKYHMISSGEFTEEPCDPALSFLLVSASKESTWLPSATSIFFAGDWFSISFGVSSAGRGRFTSVNKLHILSHRART